MAMNNALTLVFALAAGFSFGAMFYGGLWWTVSRAISSKRVALWFPVSLLLRMGLALTGLYFVSGGDWQRLLLCLLGFVLARLAVMWLKRPAEENQTLQVPEGGHAP
jgi:F1F0 ATPase subunit 2